MPVWMAPSPLRKAHPVMAARRVRSHDSEELFLSLKGIPATLKGILEAQNNGRIRMLISQAAVKRELPYQELCRCGRRRLKGAERMVHRAQYFHLGNVGSLHCDGEGVPCRAVQRAVG